MDVLKNSVNDRSLDPENQPKGLLTKIKSIVWPVHKNELNKFVPTFLIFFLLAYVYDMLRIIKSSIVVAESQVGAEIIPFLKVWAVIPGAFLITGLAMRLSHRFDREKIFYIMLSFFIVFYVLFIFFIYPNRSSLDLESLSLFLTRVLPEGAGGLVSMIGHWPLSVFYVITELWGTILLSMLIWGFANEITSIEQAGRFYPLFLLGANSAAIFAGLTSAYYAGHDFNPDLPFGSSAWEQSLMFYLSTAVVCGFLVMLLFYYMHWQGVVYTPDQKIKKNEKVKLTLSECLDCLRNSKHLLYIALLVLSYNLVFNLSDVLWENQLKMLYLDDAAGMARYKSHITTLTGTLSVIISLFVSGNLLRRCGWKYAAYLTPVTISITCTGFFWLLLFQETASTPDILLNLTSNPINLTLFFGSIQMVFSRGCKYTLFDTSKEIAFIPLSTTEKRYGKAAIDGVGSRMGKSAGSLLVQLLLLTCNSISAATPYMAFTIIIMLGVWCFAVKGLSKKLG